MMELCWIIEDIHDLFSDNFFYPSCIWEDLYAEEKENLNGK